MPDSNAISGQNIFFAGLRSVMTQGKAEGHSSPDRQTRQTYIIVYSFAQLTM